MSPKSQTLRHYEQMLVQRFGHLGLKQGNWPVIGRTDGWVTSDWPMPVFVRYEELTGRSFNVRYNTDDPNHLVSEVQVPSGVSEQGPS